MFIAFRESFTERSAILGENNAIVSPSFLILQSIGAVIILLVLFLNPDTRDHWKSRTK
jgi:hypothetical protein